MNNIPTEALQSAQSGGSGPSDEEQAKRLADEAQMRRDMLATILDVGARERLSRIALVSRERSQQIEGILLRMAQGGQLRNKVTEQQLIDLLDQLEGVQDGGNKSKKPTIIYQRRKDFDDDDFDI